MKVSYLDNQTVKQKILRTTISQIEESLRAYPEIARCHRAFLVNITHIINAEGNSQGLQLKIRHIKENIPASRSYAKIIREQINITS